MYKYGLKLAEENLYTTSIKLPTEIELECENEDIQNYLRQQMVYELSQTAKDKFKFENITDRLIKSYLVFPMDKEQVEILQDFKMMKLINYKSQCYIFTKEELEAFVLELEKFFNHRQLQETKKRWGTE